MMMMTQILSGLGDSILKDADNVEYDYDVNNELDEVIYSDVLLMIIRLLRLPLRSLADPIDDRLSMQRQRSNGSKRM